MQVAQPTMTARKGPAFLSVLAGFVVTGLSFGSLLWIPFGTFVVPLADAYGWARNDVLVGATMLNLGMVTGAPTTGMLFDRYGVRRVLLPGVLLFGLGILSLTSLGGRLWQFYLTLGLLGVVGAVTFPTGINRLIAGWFDRPARAFGIAYAGSGVGSMLLPPFFSWLLTGAGLQRAYLAMSLLVLLCVVPIVFFCVRENPDRKTTRSDPRSDPQIDSQPVSAARDWTIFIKMALAFTLSSTVLTGIMMTLVPTLIDRGVSAHDAALVMSGFAAALTLFRAASGFVLDGIRAPFSLLILTSVPIAGMACLVFGTGAVSVVLAGLCFGAALGAIGCMLMFLANRYFSPKSISRDLGLIISISQIGGAAGPMLIATLQNAGIADFQIYSLLLGLQLLAAGVFASFGTGPAEGLRVGRTAAESRR